MSKVVHGYKISINLLTYYTSVLIYLFVYLLTTITYARFLPVLFMVQCD